MIIVHACSMAIVHACVWDTRTCVSGTHIRFWNPHTCFWDPHTFFRDPHMFFRDTHIRFGDFRSIHRYRKSWFLAQGFVSMVDMLLKWKRRVADVLFGQLALDANLSCQRGTASYLAKFLVRSSLSSHRARHFIACVLKTYWANLKSLVFTYRFCIQELAPTPHEYLL